MGIGESIRRNRKEKGLTQSQLAEKMGVKTATISKYEKGIVVPPLKQLQKISEVLGVPIDSILKDGDSGEPKSVIKSLFATPDRVSSLRSGVNITKREYNIISDYMGCPLEYLFGFEGEENETDEKTAGTVYDELDAFCLVCKILDNTAANDKYRILQIQISRIIIRNLLKKDVTAGMLLGNTGLASEKVKFLYGGAEISKSDYGFNFSDVMRIIDDFGIAPGFVFTGR